MWVSMNKSRNNSKNFYREKICIMKNIISVDEFDILKSSE